MRIIWFTFKTQIKKTKTDGEKIAVVLNTEVGVNKTKKPVPPLSAETVLSDRKLNKITQKIWKLSERRQSDQSCLRPQSIENTGNINAGNEGDDYGIQNASESDIWESVQAALKRMKWAKWSDGNLDRSDFTD